MFSLLRWSAPFLLSYTVKTYQPYQKSVLGEKDRNKNKDSAEKEIFTEYIYQTVFFLVLLFSLLNKEIKMQPEGIYFSPQFIKIL